MNDFFEWDRRWQGGDHRWHGGDYDQDQDGERNGHYRHRSDASDVWRFGTTRRPIPRWPAKLPLGVLDYTLNIRDEIDVREDFINQVTVWFAPSGPSELAASNLVVSEDLLTVTLGGGQPRRDYMMRGIAAMTNGRSYPFQARIGVLPELASDRAARPTSWWFGTPLVWNFSPSLNFTEPRNAALRMWGWI